MSEEQEDRQQIRDRVAHWTNQGVLGESLFDALATDPVLPSSLSAAHVSEATGLSANTLKMRRARRMEPSFIRLTRKFIVYPKGDFFQWLKRRYVPMRHDGRARDEYTQAAR